MAGSRKPGPLGVYSPTQNMNLNDGTIIRACSPLPGPIGVGIGSKYAPAALTMDAEHAPWVMPMAPPKPMPTAQATPPKPVAPAAGNTVWNWTLEQKFSDALRRTAPKLPGSMQHEFMALLSPASLAMLVGTFVLWAGSHAFGVGEVIDILLVIAGAFFLGMAVFDVARELADFIGTTATATSEKDLDQAASHLARAIAIIGVAAFIALMTKVAIKVKGSKGGTTADGAAADAGSSPSKPKTPAKTPSPPADPPPPPAAKPIPVAKIQAMPKGTRPDPATYMSDAQIKSQLSQFEDGATKFMTKANVDKYGPAQRDGTSFVLTKSEADQLLAKTNGDKRAMEQALGLPDKFLDSNQLMRVDIPDPKSMNLRIPSGNEAGANEFWIPGGKLPDGNLEAVIDIGGAPPSSWTVTPLPF